MPDLTQFEIEQLDADLYSNFLAYGSTLVQPELTEAEYEEYLLSNIEFDL
jgi:hypothetical protein